MNVTQLKLKLKLIDNGPLRAGPARMHNTLYPPGRSHARKQLCYAVGQGPSHIGVGGGEPLPSGFGSTHLHTTKPLH